MLTKDDLRQIGILVENVVEEVVDRKLEEKLKPIKKQLRAIKKDQKIMFNFLDREQMKQRKRIDLLEDYVGLA